MKSGSRKSTWIFAILGIFPVIWFALLTAPYLSGGLIGIVVGPFVGAVAGELLNDRERIGQALVVGVGSFLSFLVGTGIKLVAAVGMLTFVVADTWPALRAWFATVF